MLTKDGLRHLWHLRASPSVFETVCTVATGIAKSVVDYNPPIQVDSVRKSCAAQVLGLGWRLCALAVSPGAFNFSRPKMTTMDQRPDFSCDIHESSPIQLNCRSGPLYQYLGSTNDLAVHWFCI